MGRLCCSMLTSARLALAVAAGIALPAAFHVDERRLPALRAKVTDHLHALLRHQGQGLLVDFTDVDGSKRSYNTSEPVVREHLGGKN